MNTLKYTFLKITLLALLVAVVAFGMPGQATQAQSPTVLQGEILEVTSTIDAPDANPGDGLCETAVGNNVCTLRAAIQEANALPGEDRVFLDALTYVLTRPGEDATALNGDLDITDDLTIYGLGRDNTYIDGGALDRVFDIDYASPPVTVRMSSLTIQNGKPVQNGGGIYNYGDLTLTNATVRNNYTGNYGGGILNQATLTLINSIVSDNKCSCLGGGISNSHGSVTLIDSAVSGNIASSSGGGISSFGQKGSSTVTLINSLVSSNKATYHYGGGIYNYGSGDGNGSTVTLINSTVSGNHAGKDGGGIYNDSNGTVNLHNATVAYNEADLDTDGVGVGGGIFNKRAVNFLNAILSENVIKGPILDDADDCEGTLTSLDYNLLRSSAGCTIVGAIAHNLLVVNAQLGALQFDGGRSDTHPLLANSAAIDTGNPVGCADPLGAALTTDQRGYVRHTNGRCDIGAYEYGAVTWVAPALYVYLPTVMQ